MIKEKKEPKRKHTDIKEIIEPGWKVDKIKFKYILRKLEEIQKILDNLAVDTRLTKAWESRDFKQSSKNFNLEINGATVYIGL